MNFQKPILFTLLLVLTSGFFNSASTQVSIVPLSGNDKAHKHEGIYYALPKTLIRVDVWVDKIEVFRGPYAEYAGRLLGLDNVPVLNSTSYHLAGVSMSTFHEVDSEHLYFARIPEKETNNLRLYLSPDGILQAANQEEPTRQEKKSGASNIPQKPLLKSDFVDITIPNLIEKVDTFIRRINVDTTTFEEIFFRKTFIEKTTEQKAREAANFILKLEDHRFSLITGYHEVNYSAEVMQFMNNQLLTLQNEYLALFKGKKTTSTSYYSFIYEPRGSKDISRQTLFKFATARGILDKESPAGEAVQIHCNKAGNVFPISEHQTIRDKAQRKQAGFYYRIPDKAEITIQLGNEIIAQSQFLVNQLGVVSFLPYEGVREIQFYPETGSVKYFRLK